MCIIVGHIDCPQGSVISNYGYVTDDLVGLNYVQSICTNGRLCTGANRIGTLVAEQVASSPLWELVASMVVCK